jgi:antitoxin ParD1/3/4
MWPEKRAAIHFRRSVTKIKDSPMTQLSITLTDEARDFVERTAKARGLRTPSEFIEELVERERSRRNLDQLLLDGLDSGEPIAVTDEWWERKRTELSRRIAGGAK